MQVSLCPMQLVPQLDACDWAVPFIASVQSEQLSHPPPAVHRYSVLDVTAGRAGVHMTLDAASPALPSTGTPESPFELLLLDPLLPPELEPLLDPLLLSELEPLLPELPPSSPADCC